MPTLAHVKGLSYISLKDGHVIWKHAKDIDNDVVKQLLLDHTKNIDPTIIQQRKSIHISNDYSSGHENLVVLTKKRPLVDFSNQVVGLISHSYVIPNQIKQPFTAEDHTFYSIDDINDLDLDDSDQIIEILPVMISIKNEKDQQLYANFELRQYLSLPAEINYTSHQLYDPETARKKIQFDQHVFKTGKTHTQIEYNNYEASRHSTLTTRIRIKPDRLLNISNIIETTNNPKEVETYSRYRNYLDLNGANALTNTPGNIYWKDAQGRYILQNRQHALQATKGNIKDIIGKTDYELFKDDKVFLYCQNDDRVVKNKQHLITEEEFGRSYISHKAPLYTKAGGIFGVAGSSIDITELKEKEAKLTSAKESAEETTELVRTFTEQLAHDVRTPLTGLIGTIDRIKEKYPDETLCMELSHATDGILKLFEQANDMIANDYREAKNHFDLGQCFDTIISLIKPSADSKNLSLFYEFNWTNPTAVFGFQGVLTKVVLNILSNAVKYTNKGNITVNATLSKTDISITISDTGVGMTQAEIQSAFSKHIRFNQERNQQPGTGLGLFMVDQLIQFAEGRIDMKSKKEHGTIVTIQMPLVAGQPTQTQSTTHTPTKQNTRLKSHVLVVEDDKLAALMVVNRLKNLGITVTLEKNASAAINKTFRQTFDLIFMDIGLPDLSGLDTCVAIRQNDDNPNQHTPIIALSGQVFKNDTDRFLQNGFQEVISKPIDERSMARALGYISHSSTT